MSRAKQSKAASKDDARSTGRVTALVRKNNGDLITTTPQIAQEMINRGRAMWAEPQDVEQKQQRLAERGAQKKEDGS